MTPHRHHRLGYVLAGLLAVGAMALTACGSDDTEAAASGERKLTKITIGASSDWPQQPMRWGEEKGFWAEEGLDPEFVEPPDDPSAQIAAVAKGDLTFSFGPTSIFIRAIEEGAPVKIVGSGFRSKGPFWFIAGNHIETFADLKGKTVGTVIPAGSLHTYASVILQENGIDPKRDVKLVANGGGPEGYGTLLTGQVDATISEQPFATQVEADGKGKVLARGWKYLPRYHTGSVIAGQRLIDEDPELLRRILRAYYRIYTEAKANYDEYIPWLQEQNPDLDPKIVEQAIRAEDDIWDANPDVDPEAIRETQEIEVREGNQKEVFPFEDVIDLRFIPKEYVKPFSYEVGER